MSDGCQSAPQLNYADMLKRVEPLRNELQKLEDDAKDNQQKANEVEQMIRDLEASIARYKEEYAVLISEAQAIKADLAAVEAKVRRPAGRPEADEARGRGLRCCGGLHASARGCPLGSRFYVSFPGRYALPSTYRRCESRQTAAD